LLNAQDTDRTWNLHQVDFANLPNRPNLAHHVRSRRGSIRQRCNRDISPQRLHSDYSWTLRAFTTGTSYTRAVFWHSTERGNCHKLPPSSAREDMWRRHRDEVPATTCDFTWLEIATTDVNRTAPLAWENPHAGELQN